MSNSKETILARLNQTRASLETQDTTSLRTLSRKHHNQQPSALLIERLQENRIEVHVLNEKDWPDQIQLISEDKKINTWLVGSGGPIAKRAQHAIQTTESCTAVVYDKNYEDLRDVLFHHIDASITSAQAAIAETGTLIIVPDKHEPRMMSLIPPIHAVVLDARKVVFDFDQLLDNPPWPEPKNAAHDQATMPSNIVFVSSPSKTADIQQTLAYGAHGPKEVIVFLIAER